MRYIPKFDMYNYLLKLLHYYHFRFAIIKKLRSKAVICPLFKELQLLSYIILFSPWFCLELHFHFLSLSSVHYTGSSLLTWTTTDPSTQVTLDWAEENAAVTTYRLIYDPNDADPFSPIESTGSGPIPITNMNPGTWYYFELYTVTTSSGTFLSSDLALVTRE